ncbi:MAG: methyltransferase family protein [Promethearchaeota archaeon]
MKQENNTNNNILSKNKSSPMKKGIIFRIIAWIIMLVGGTLLGILLDRIWFPLLWHSAIFHILIFIPGTLLMWLVFHTSRVTGRLLAKQGREGEIPRMETNRLVVDGIYGCMRHPMHLGLLFFPLSLAMILGSTTFIIMIAPLEMLLMIFMIKILEEPEAIAKFGDQYREYMKNVPMFNFSPKCLRYLFSPAENENKTENENQK